MTRVRGWGSATKLRPASGIGRGARGRVECPRMWRGREGSTIDICRGRLSAAPWRGIVAIVWTRWRGRLKEKKERERERERGRETDREGGRERKRRKCKKISNSLRLKLTHLSLIGRSIAWGRGVPGRGRGSSPRSRRRKARLIGIHIAMSCNKRTYIICE